MGSTKYTLLDVNDSKNNSQEDLLIMERNYMQHHLWYLLGNGLLLLTSAIIFALSRHIALPIPTDIECSKLFSTLLVSMPVRCFYSVNMAEAEGSIPGSYWCLPRLPGSGDPPKCTHAQQAIKYQTVKFNGTFDFSSIYCGLPNPVLDTVWDNISINVKATWMDKNVLGKISKKETLLLVKFLEEDGGGFMTFLHFPDHRVELLHQELMCITDVGVITYNTAILRRYWTGHTAMQYISLGST
ncbi:hypothetical protein BT96DRAFT_936763 [Gymnopus androsaceus JB14]|uniref:Uncharacterized protein n=1 Tax=Gymnopus androsaceus JB14 TaxID=1447944 RepID=A0A6A4HX11_9AGAR|nr:hypothetical protein BT96DRAFT_936763 [Gymnopus androsaceus JB14]